jgi:hypothetical protein
MNTDLRGSAARLAGLRRSVLFCALLAFTACAPGQEGEPIVDVEPERQINTDLSFPKNPHRWAYAASRVSTDPRDPFAGYRVVLANPFAARLREEGKTANRGIKLAQFIYEVRQDASGVAPGELRRVNLIVKDPERYGATGGWGYASYDADGRALPVNPATDCISCHTSGPVTAYFPKP